MEIGAQRALFFLGQGGILWVDVRKRAHIPSRAAYTDMYNRNLQKEESA